MRPATKRSESVSERVQGDLLPEPTKKTETVKNGDSKRARRNPLRDLPGWLQEFKENRVEESVPEHGDPPASSSREPPVE